MKLEEIEKSCDCPTERVVGVEIQGVYDGVLFWQCRECGARWHRFPKGSRRRNQTEGLWARWDEE